MIKNIHFTWLSCLVIIFCLLSGCSQLATTTAPSTSLPRPELKKPEYHKIANNYLNQALQATKNFDIQEYKLKAAENFILAEEIDSAIDLSRNIEITNQNHEAYLAILKAQIALQKKQIALAKQNLQSIVTPKQLPAELQTKFYQTRANLYLRTENPLDAAKDNIELAQHLATTAEKDYKNKEILAILSKLTPSALQESQQHGDDENLNGWLSFTHIMKQYDTNPAQMTRAIAVWQNNYPNHPANNMFPNQAEQINQRDNNPIDLPPPKRIALLLPLTGPYAASAEIIKDGFLAAHYEQIKTNNSKTEVHIYTTATSDGAAQAYNNAIDAQADFIVGPLIKDDIKNLIAISDRDIPILALNTITTRSYYSNLFQFGLLPETDATELAEQLWRDGHRKVLIIVPTGDWGNRIAIALRDRFQQYAGKTLAIEKIAPHADLSQKMRRILAVANSDPKSNVKPSRRQDIDAIVIATSPMLARQLKPLLNFYYASDIPVYAHSSVYSGKPAPIQDQDLNGITFCDMPWLLDHTITSKSVYKNIATLWPNKLAQSPRLYAFGIDAYKIANQLQQLKNMPNFGISGMTGILTLDEQQKIDRKLMWAKFNDGIPKLINAN